MDRWREAGGWGRELGDYDLTSFGRDPLRENLAKPQQTRFFIRKTGVFIFIMPFTKQVLFRHSENKNHPPDGGWFAVALRREGDCLRRFFEGIIRSANDPLRENPATPNYSRLVSLVWSFYFPSVLAYVNIARSAVK